MQNLNELKLDVERLERMKNNVQKNYDRRKKLNLLDPPYERQLKEDIRKLESDISSLNRQMRSIESQQYRSKMINDSK